MRQGRSGAAPLPERQQIFGFEVAVRDGTGVANVPVTVDLGRVRTRGYIEIG